MKTFKHIEITEREFKKCCKHFENTKKCYRKARLINAGMLEGMLKSIETLFQRVKIQRSTIKMFINAGMFGEILESSELLLNH